MLFSLSCESLFLDDGRDATAASLCVCRRDETAEQMKRCVCVEECVLGGFWCSRVRCCLLHRASPWAGSSGSPLEAHFTQIHADQTLHWSLGFIILTHTRTHTSTQSINTPVLSTKSCVKYETHVNHDQAQCQLLFTVEPLFNSTHEKWNELCGFVF